MKYVLIKDYTHHGGTQLLLSEIPEGTILVPSKSQPDEPMYETVSHGKEPCYLIPAKIVENFPTYFELLDEEEFQRNLAKEQIFNAIQNGIDNGIEAQEAIFLICDEFDIPYTDTEEMPEKAEEIKEESIEKEDESEKIDEIKNWIEEQLNKMNGKENTKSFPSYPSVPSYPQDNQFYCHCGNDGSKPCWSTACPKRIIVTYGIGTGDPLPNHFTTTTSIFTMKNRDKDGH